MLARNFERNRLNFDPSLVILLSKIMIKIKRYMCLKTEKIHLFHILNAICEWYFIFAFLHLIFDLSHILHGVLAITQNNRFLSFKTYVCNKANFEPGATVNVNVSMVGIKTFATFLLVLIAWIKPAMCKLIQDFKESLCLLL